MKGKIFYEKCDELYEECMDIMKTKGQAYSGTEDKLGNFKRVAKNLSMTPKQVWYVYFSKHLDALSAYLRGEYVDSEPIMGRIKDLINYLYLFMGLYEEQEQEKAEKDFDMRLGQLPKRVDTEDLGDMFEGEVTVVNLKGRDEGKEEGE